MYSYNDSGFQIEGQFSSPCITRYLSLLSQFLFFLKSEIRNSHVTTDRRYIGLNNIYEYQWFRCCKQPCIQNKFCYIPNVTTSSEVVIYSILCPVHEHGMACTFNRHPRSNCTLHIWWSDSRGRWFCIWQILHFRAFLPNAEHVICHCSANFYFFSNLKFATAM